MRAIVALLLCIWLPAQALTSPRCAGLSALRDPTCQLLQLDGIVGRKTIIDALTEASLSQRLSIFTDNGAKGSLDFALVDGLPLYRASLSPDSPVALTSFTLSLPSTMPPAFGWMQNAPGDLVPDFALRDSLAPTEVSFVFRNGLQPGQASRWIVDLNGGPSFAPLGLGSVTDAMGGPSLPQPLLAAVPEPASAALMVAGMLALAWRRRHP